MNRLKEYELFDAVLTKTVLKQLGVSSKDRLIFDNGSFHIRRKVNATNKFPHFFRKVLIDFECEINWLMVEKESRTGEF